MRGKPSFVIQQRDIAILRGFLESRVMTHKHVSALYFEGRGDAAKKRLQKLKAANLLAERPRKTFDRSVLFPTAAAFVLLRERGILNHYPTLTLSEHSARVDVSDATIRHELAVINLKASFYGACEKGGTCRVAEFSTWPQLNQFEAAPFRATVTVKPDGYIRILKKGRSEDVTRSFYLELDRSTETHSRLLLKANCYQAHFKTGGFAVKNGMPRADFWKQPFHALFVFESAERRNNFAEALLAATPPILTRIWLTTFDEVTRDPLGAIWIRPVDFGEAVETPLHTNDRKRAPRKYRRNRQRDSIIEACVLKRRLLE